MPETTPLIKAALNLRGGAGFDVYDTTYMGVEETADYVMSKLDEYLSLKY